jgi:hypothetical protein
MRNLRWMHPRGTGSLIDGFEPCERFERYTGFACGTVLCPLCRHRLSPPLPLLWTQHALVITCPVVAIGRALQPFPCPKRSVRLSPHSAFQLGLWTLEGRIRRHRRRGAPVAKDRHLLSPLHPFASLLTGFPWRACTMPWPLQPSVGRLRRRRPPSRALAFSRPTAGRRRSGVPQFPSMMLSPSVAAP